MSNPKALPLRSGTSQTLVSASSPLSPTQKQKFRRLKSQNLVSSKQIQKRELQINVTNAPSPFNLAAKNSENCLGGFSTVLDDFNSAKRPSMSSMRNDEASTRAGTLTCLSRNNIKASQTPNSLTSLHCENLTPSLCLKDMNSTIRRADETEIQTNTSQKVQFNGTILSLGRGHADSNDARQASVSLVAEGSRLEALELMEEDNLTQRSNRKEEETKRINFSIRKEEKVVAVTRSGKKTKKVLEMTKSRKTKRECSEKNKETLSTNVNRVKKDENGVEQKPREKVDNMSLKKTESEENNFEKEEKVIRENLKGQKNIQGNLLVQNILSYQRATEETVKPQSILEIKTLRANTLHNISKAQEFAEMRHLHNSSQGGGISNIERKSEFKNERGLDRHKYRSIESSSIEIARDKSANLLEEQFHYSSDVTKLIQITRRPTLRRMKSELQAYQNLVERDNQSQNLGGTKEQIEKPSQENQKEIFIAENDPYTERLALKEIQGVDQKKEVETMELSKKSRNEERRKVYRREEKEELKQSGNRKTTQDIWKNIWDEEKVMPDPKFELFKQTGNNFFELNLENKFLQKYGFLRTLEENALNTEEERVLTENLVDGGSTPENMRTEMFSRRILKTLPSEYASKESKSEKTLKINPTTMMVRYYDELNPLVIQPKYMASTGSMCVTELWGNKNKQDFYKTMRKPFQSNTIFSLNPQPGVYRPEKPSNNGDQNYKKMLSERIDKENETGGSKSPSMKDNFAFRSSRRARHTRAFVLQGTSDNQMKKGVYPCGYSSREGALP